MRCVWKAVEWIESCDYGPEDLGPAVFEWRKSLEAHRSSKPYPEWAVKALTAGWKAPKGWKP